MIPPQTICIDLSPAIHGRAGIGRMAGELYAHLRQLEHPYNLKVFYNNALAVSKNSQQAITSPAITLPWGDKKWRLAVLGAHFLRRSQNYLFPDSLIFHGTDHLIPYVEGVKTVFTLHDLTPFSHRETHATLNRLYSRMMIPIFLRRADLIVTDSECTRQEMFRFFPHIPAEKTAVNHLGIADRFRPIDDRRETDLVRQKYGLPEKFFLYVGTIEPRKNITAIIRAFDRAQVKNAYLVIAGKRGWGSEPVFKLVEDLALEDRVLFPGFIDDRDLPTLYNLAEVFVYPSLFEGFGFPVLEAMACGTPTICSGISSLSEIAGKAAWFVDPLNVPGIADALQKFSRDPNLRSEYRLKGLEQAGRFSWRDTAVRTLQHYASLLG